MGVDAKDWQRMITVNQATPVALPVYFDHIEDQYLEEAIVASAPSNTSYVDSTPVPTNELWSITAINAMDVSTAVTRIQIAIRFASVTYYFYREAYPDKVIGISWSGSLMMCEAHFIRVGFIGCTIGDELRVGLVGHKLKQS